MFVLHFICQSKKAQSLGNYSSFDRCTIYFDKLREARSYASDVLFYAGRVLNLSNGKEHLVV